MWRKEPVDRRGRMTMSKSTTLAGLTLEELAGDYRDRLFKQYLPFWDKGGYDSQLGGFMCELHDDGTVADDTKHIWYQGRGIWVYSYLYNRIRKEASYREIACKSAEFLKKNFYLGEGNWRSGVSREGQPVADVKGQGSDKDIYGALFSAAGLIEFYKVNGDPEDLKIAIDSIKASVRRYENPEYEGVSAGASSAKGLRTQGHSFMFVWVLSDLLSFHDDAALSALQREHVQHLTQHFWNPDFGIVNEHLRHDYSRLPGQEGVMLASGHSLEALWMVMHEAKRVGDKQLFATCKERIRRLIEMTWDYVFGGMCSEDYHVFETDGKRPGPNLDLKVMWAHTEMLIATLSVFEHTGETWAREWYERCRAYSHRCFATKSHGVWIQAVDRMGADKQRPGISIHRKDNFHQIRYLMMNLEAIERMIQSQTDTRPREDL